MLAQQSFIWIRQLMIDTLHELYAGCKLIFLEARIDGRALVRI